MSSNIFGYNYLIGTNFNMNAFNSGKTEYFLGNSRLHKFGMIY